MNDLVRNRLKEILQLQDSIKLKKLNYIAKISERYVFSNVSLPIIFSRDIYTNVLSIENANNEKVIYSKN